MHSFTFILGICVFILGGIGVYFFKKRNDNKLNPEKKKIVDSFSWNITSFNAQVDIALIILITLVSIVLFQKILGFEMLGFAVLIWLVGVFSLKGTIVKNKAIERGVSSEYVKTNLKIGCLFLTFTSLSSLIILFS